VRQAQAAITGAGFAAAGAVRAEWHAKTPDLIEEGAPTVAVNHGPFTSHLDAHYGLMPLLLPVAMVVAFSSDP